MKLRVLTTCALLLLSVQLIIAQTSDRVVLYSDDFVGNSLDLGVGRHDFMSLAKGGIAVVRSVKVPAGMQVTLYDRDQFEGTSLVLTSNASMAFLTSKGFGQITQNVSVVVEFAKPADTGGPAITIFRDNYTGGSARLGVGFYDFQNLGAVGNDQLSSVRIPKGLQVTLYEHGNSGGRKLVLTADSDVEALKKNKFDNLTSSILVEQLPPPKEAPVKIEEKKEQQQEPQQQEEEKPQPKEEPVKLIENPASPTIIVFSGNKAGNAKQFGPGSYDAANLDIEDNSISSVRVMDGVRVTLFDQQGFRGKSLQLEQDADFDAMEKAGFNDITSSMVVEYLPKAVIFENNFSGKYASLEVGNYNTNDLQISNDQLSSISLRGGVWALLFSDANFKGESVLLTKDASSDFLDGKEFNNKTSSMVVGAKDDVMPVVTLYGGEYGNQIKQLTPGNYALLNPDNAVSSLDFPRGLRVTLFEHPNFQGASITLFKNTDSESLKNNNFSRVASSAKIEWIHPRNLVVTIYDEKFQGLSQELKPGRYNTKDIKIGDKKISSLKVPDRMSVTLHDQDYFKGMSITVTADKDFTGSKLFDNIYSSIIVEDVTEPLITGRVAVPPGTTQQTTTTTTTTTTVEQPQTQEVVQVVEVAPCGMSDSDYQKALKAVESKPFSGDRLEMARLTTKGKCLTNDQIRGLAGLFGFEENKMTFVKEAYEKAKEKDTYYELENVFKFLSGREEFLKFVKEQ